jgi:hypothetical protein
MSVRVLKWIVAVLCCALLLLAWKTFVVSLQIQTASGISSACEETERIAISESDPVALALQIQWLQVHYRLNIERLSGSHLHRIARIEYEHTLTNSFSALRRMTTNDLGNDVSAWLARLQRREH